MKAGDVYPVLSGLVARDRLATSANFLIDSESSLRAAIESMQGAPAGHKH
jgi:hypothetical protein